MSIAELVPSWKGLPPPSGSIIEGTSFKKRRYRLRKDDVRFGLEGIATARGIENIDEFARPTLAALPDPSLLRDMDEGAVRLARAVERREKILVFGDYDVDGASSTSVMIRFVDLVGHRADHFIPDRVEHGYGPSQMAFDLCRPNDYDLVIFVDCGTASAELLDDLTCDVIVVDHHKQQGVLPAVVACINPHREDDDSGLGMMCAAGLAFMLCVATRRTMRARGMFDGKPQPDVRELLDIAALATVADVVPLVGASRLIVSAGLDVMSKKPSVGVAALMAVAGVNEPSSGRIGFALGPRINAAGRVGKGVDGEGGALGVELLTCRDPHRASEIASRLNSLNAERQEVEKGVLLAAMEDAERQVANGARIIGVWSEEWHPGVVGIVAGRIRERFDLPALVGACEKGMIKASGRSVPGLDLGALIVEARACGRLAGGGGHAMACGLSVVREGWDDLMAFLSRKASWQPEPLIVDCRADAGSLSMDDVTSLERLQPVGQGNPSANVVIEGFRISQIRKFGNGHVRLLSDRRDMEALFWRAEDEGLMERLEALVGSTVSLVGVPRVDEWQGRRKVSVDCSDVIV